MGLQAALRRASNGLLPVDTGRRGLSPFVKWAGGKTSILPQLLSYVPDQFNDYYEPFLGGGALYLAVCGRTTSFKAHLSDTNVELINTYRVIKDRPDELKSQLSVLQSEYYSARDKESYYYQTRAWQPGSDVESAARLIFLNKTCYNGLYRVNSKGQFNVPFGDYKRPRILYSEGVDSISQALRETKATLRHVEYKAAVKDCKKNDFVYLDPPYHPISKTSSFTGYTSDGFSEKDQEELAYVFSDLAGRDCRVLLSNSDTPFVRRLYKNFEVTSLLVPRPINSVALKRRGVRELIVANTWIQG